ncbi:hypothetical protein [Lichenifustis flavocetrariae]|nr:hypothetical protein [Lichenifustis flavocetrariae]
MLLTALYANRAGEDCRARRIFSPLTAKPDRGKFDGGDVAHIVRLTTSPLDDSATEVALCGAYLRAGRKWSGIRAYSTCHTCIARAKQQPPSITGWKHKLAETQYLKVKEMLCLPPLYLDNPVIKGVEDELLAPPAVEHPRYFRRLLRRCAQRYFRRPAADGARHRDG